MIRPHLREPIWRHTHLPSSLNPPRALWSWLRDHGSLTRRLQRFCGCRFNVELLSERWERVRPSEAPLLGLPPGRLARVRQVYLNCGSRCWVYARTVIPEATLRGPNAGLTRLGNRPLGAYLFSHPRARRGQLQWGEVRHSSGAIFGRRSLFYLRDKPLLVSEFFLHDFVVELLP